MKVLVLALSARPLAPGTADGLARLKAAGATVALASWRQLSAEVTELADEVHVLGRVPAGRPVTRPQALARTLRLDPHRHVAARAARRLSLDGVDLLVAADTTSVLAAWRLGRRHRLTAVNGLTAAQLRVAPQD